MRTGWGFSLLLASSSQSGVRKHVQPEGPRLFDGHRQGIALFHPFAKLESPLLRLTGLGDGTLDNVAVVPCLGLSAKDR
jgi:hypothetical protein